MAKFLCYISSSWRRKGGRGGGHRPTTGASIACWRRGAFKESAAAPTGPTNTDRLLPRFYFHIILISKGLPGRISISPGIKDKWEKEGEADEEEKEVGSHRKAVRNEEERKNRNLYIYVYIWGYVMIRQKRQNVAEFIAMWVQMLILHPYWVYLSSFLTGPNNFQDTRAWIV